MAAGRADDRAELLAKVRLNPLKMPSIRGILLLVVALIQRVESKLVGAAVLPHGDFAYDPTLFERYQPNSNATQKSYNLYHGSKDIGAWITALQPDTVDSHHYHEFIPLR